MINECTLSPATGCFRCGTRESLKEVTEYDEIQIKGSIVKVPFVFTYCGACKKAFVTNHQIKRNDEYFKEARQRVNQQ
jgi:hypothetical protein